MNIVAQLDTNLMLPSDIPTLTPESIHSRIHGSKLVLVVEQSMIMTIWGCKFCLLLLYNRMTFGLKKQLRVKIVAAYVVTALIVMEILYFGVWCRPFYNYWAVPTDNGTMDLHLHRKGQRIELTRRQCNVLLLSTTLLLTPCSTLRLI